MRWKKFLRWHGSGPDRAAEDDQHSTLANIVNCAAAQIVKQVGD
jgi:hypothetical protein